MCSNNFLTFFQKFEVVPYATHSLSETGTLTFALFNSDTSTALYTASIMNATQTTLLSDTTSYVF